MEFKEAIKLALQSLWQNKLRTVLTLLGMMISVASIIAVATLVNGAETYVTTKFTRYGADVFTVSRMPSIIFSSEQYEKMQRRKDILYDDYTYVRDNCTRCVGIGQSQGTSCQGGARDQFGDRLHHPRVHLADAHAAEPGHRRGAGIYVGR